MKYLFLFAIFILPSPVFANLYITELYPAPTQGNVEWIEVYNSADQPIDIYSSYLEDESGKKIYFSEGIISGNSYSVATASSILNNSGDRVWLKKADGTVIDMISYSMTISSSESYSRCSDNIEWKTVPTITRGFDNNLVCTSNPSPTPTHIVVPTPTPSTQSPTGTQETTTQIILSEIYPYPKPGEEKWIELYNPLESDVRLSNWYIDDIESGGASPVSFSATIPARGYAVVFLPKQILNNGGDTIRILNSALQTVIRMQFKSVARGFSMGKENLLEDHLCTMESTPNTTNVRCKEEIDQTSQEVEIDIPVLSNLSTEKPLRISKKTISKKVQPSKTPVPRSAPEDKDPHNPQNTSYTLAPKKDITSHALFFTGSTILALTGILSIGYRLYRREYGTDWQISEIPLY